MTEWDEVHNAYVKALQEYRSIDRNLAVARSKLSAAERARKVVFDKLVEAAQVRTGTQCSRDNAHD